MTSVRPVPLQNRCHVNTVQSRKNRAASLVQPRFSLQHLPTILSSKRPGICINESHWSLAFHTHSTSEHSVWASGCVGVQL